MVPDVVLTIRDAGRTVYLNAGQCLAVDLEDISTTGFRWTFSTPDDSVLSLEGNEFHGHTGVGGGGVRRLLTRPSIPDGRICVSS